MGQEIGADHFRKHDFHAFERHFRQESALLEEMFASGGFSRTGSIAGLELEAWLVDPQGDPLAINDELLARVALPSVVPELSKFNIEFNVEPQPLAGLGLARLAEELASTWRTCQGAANELGASVVAVGILPTVEDRHLSLAHISEQRRYRALNEQILRLRHGSPLCLDIAGPCDVLQSEHRDVMLEAAATSLQVHLQVPCESAVRYYNASLVAAAPLVAVAANAPFLFGKLLWEETRIPVFEQAIGLSGDLPRVTFGTHFARETLASLFSENAERYAVLLPFDLGCDTRQLAHVRLHNGTIWRWVRPLIGFDADETPHLRIEHRVMSAGPSLIDMQANAAFFYGLVEHWAHKTTPVEETLSFEAARRAFYEAARHGLRAELPGPPWRGETLREWILETCLPEARQGLERLRVDSHLADAWLTVIEERVASGRTGSQWQRLSLERCDGNRERLVEHYRDNQRSGEPVHRWLLPT